MPADEPLKAGVKRSISRTLELSTGPAQSLKMSTEGNLGLNARLRVASGSAKGFDDHHCVVRRVDTRKEDRPAVAGGGSAHQY